jgi:beta-lactamase superfamily II metal-dependent hydrolase
MSVQVKMLPIRDGDATLLTDGCAKILIDTGRNPTEVATFLNESGIDELDLVIISHIDFDHIGGLEELIDRVRIKELWCWNVYAIDRALKGLPAISAGEERLSIDPFVLRLVTADSALRKAHIKGVPCFEVSEGWTGVFGSFALEVLWPPREFLDHILKPEVLKRVFNEKVPPTDWLTEEFHEGDMSREERKHLAKKLIAEEIDERRIRKPREGDKDQGDAWPGRSFANNLSTTVSIQLLGSVTRTRMLFPGDLEDWFGILARHGLRLRSEIWKVPHHGSRHVGGRWRPVQFPWPLYPMFGKWIRERHRMTIWDLARFIEPSKSLVFPSQHGLPDCGLESGPIWGEIVSNREASLLPLRDKRRAPAEAVITI